MNPRGQAGDDNAAGSSAASGTSGASAGGTGGSSAGSSAGGSKAVASGGAPIGGATAGGATSSGGSSAQGGALASGGTSGAAAGGASNPTAGAAGTSSAGTSGGGADGSAGSGTGGTAGESGGAGTGAGGTSSDTLPQDGNPIYGQLDNYEDWLSNDGSAADKLSADRTRADNIVSWQMPHGGFYKHAVSVYAAPWNGSAERSGWRGANNVELGTIDNQATVTELMFLADVYQRSGENKYRDSARKALDFLLGMQYASGGFPQVFPERPNSYSNYVTFNDDAMVRVLILLHQALNSAPPLDGDLFSAEQRAKLATAIAKGVDYILEAQIVQAGTKTVWCAQHDPITYAPRGARSYELASKSGSESIGVIAFLMTQPQTPEVKAAVQAAIAWFKSPQVRVADTSYVSRPSANTDDNYNPIRPSPGSAMWYRFYDLDRDVGFFSGRLPTDDPPGTGKKYDIMQIEPERRYGYQWGGAYGTRIFAYTDRVGY